ncbi:MAG: tRNA 2-thiouridine synthesizing protein D [Kangiellaceae bacterium]|jgi:tRNA 2-thiouridine synthesizing protein D
MIETTSVSFTVMVTKSPFDQRNAESAINFCYAALKQGHQISQVFFYQTGIHNASQLLSPNSDELDIRKKWCELNEEHGVCLNVCVTAASRRGVVDKQIAPKPEFANLIYPFTQVGLTAYFESLASGSVNIQL